MSQLEEIKKGVEACRTYDFGMRYANKLAHEDAYKLIAALEAVEALLGEQDGYYVTDLCVHKNKLRQTITEALQ